MSIFISCKLSKLILKALRMRFCLCVLHSAESLGARTSSGENNAQLLVFSYQFVQEFFKITGNLVLCKLLVLTFPASLI